MDLYLDIVYFISFFMMILVTMKILLSSNFNKFFKQGKINEIRVAYFVVSVIVSFLASKAFVTIIEVIYNILSK